MNAPLRGRLDSTEEQAGVKTSSLYRPRGYAHDGALTVTGRTFGEEAAGAKETPGQPVIH